jgi:hypothetical protein
VDEELVVQSAAGGEENPRERLMDRAHKTIFVPVPVGQKSAAPGEVSADASKKKPRDADIETGDETPVEVAAADSMNAGNPAMGTAQEQHVGTLSLETMWSGQMSARIGITRYPEVVFYIEDANVLYPAPAEIPAEKLWLSEKGFEPSALALHVGQPLDISTFGAGLHTVHAFAKTGEFFQAMPKPGTITKRFKAAQVAIKIACELHPNEVATAYVFDHPYYAVSDAQGRAQIRALPKGEYMLVATIGEARVEKRRILFDGLSKKESFAFSTNPEVNVQLSKLSAAK